MEHKKASQANETASHLVREFIDDDHPCIMAKSALMNDQVTVASYKSMLKLCPYNLLNDLRAYLKNIEKDSIKFQTFIAVFTTTDCSSELEFENNLWKILYKLHTIDTHPWDRSTISNPDSPKFSFSLLGESFYIVGMHPYSSRRARSSPVPMIVFNLHSQFELLREKGGYDRVRDLIRKRDKANQGSVNPMVEDFGTNSEARQYSGRAVGADWKCPYNFEAGS